MKVLLMSNPTAMMSLAFSLANFWTFSIVKVGLKRNFSSSVSWMTRGTSNTSCSHLESVNRIIRALFTW